MRSFKKIIAAVPYATTDSERVKYVIFRATTAVFAALFLLGLIALEIGSVVLESPMSGALHVIWRISVLMYVVMWVVTATRYYKTVFLIWTFGLSLIAYFLITIVASETSVYRNFAFMMVVLLVMSAFLKRANLYAAAAYLFAVILFAITKAGLGTPEFIFPILIMAAFSIGAIELNFQIRGAEDRSLAQERALALHSSRLSTLGETTAFVVHEVSTPLTILNGHLELMRINENIGYHIDKMQNALDRAIEFISSVKKMVRSNEPDEYESIQLSEILKMVSDLVEPTLRRKGIKLEFDYQDDIELQCRPAEIAQVILNLVNNSAEAIGSLPERWIRVLCKLDGKFLNIDVSDPGAGIDPSVARKIMDPFFTTKATGSGIGLSIAQQVSSHHDGRIDVIQLKGPTIMRLRVATSPAFVRSGNKTIATPHAARSRKQPDLEV